MEMTSDSVNLSKKNKGRKYKFQIYDNSPKLITKRPETLIQKYNRYELDVEDYLETGIEEFRDYVDDYKFINELINEFKGMKFLNNDAIKGIIEDLDQLDKLFSRAEDSYMEMIDFFDNVGFDVEKYRMRLDDLMERHYSIDIDNLGIEKRYNAVHHADDFSGGVDNIYGRIVEREISFFI